jgi:hypothetical protein
LASSKTPTSSVYIEYGARRCFACSLDWPGLARSGKGDDGALAALGAYLPRYAPIARRAGLRFPLAGGAQWAVVERVPTRSGGADFGAPTAVLDKDADVMAPAELGRATALLEASWAYLDEVVAGSPEALRKGPRGGGRDRDAVEGHVARAERVYAAKVGLKLPEPADRERATIVANRAALSQWYRLAGASEDSTPGWPRRYALRRLVWHVLDHAWEIEDRRS